MTKATPYTIPTEPGRWRAVAVALVMHAALLALLWFSVQWQNETPLAVEAEIWNPQAREAAPPPAPEEKPEPEPEPEPKPAEIVPPLPDPDIALQAEKKRKDILKKEKQEQQERKDKLLNEKKRLEKEKTDALAKKRKQDQQEQQALDKVRADNLKRMMAQAGSGTTGDAAKSQGMRGDVSYLGKIAAKIKGNTVFYLPENLQGNPPVEYIMDLLPDGSLRSVKLLKPSGLPGFDDAVLRAIKKSEPYPADKSGTVPSTITVVQKPKD